MLLLLFTAYNVFVFFLFDWDKAQAVRDGWRVSERQLLTLAALGGWPALKIGQRLLRHKTRKQPFGRNLNILASLNVLWVCAMLYVAGPSLPSWVFGWPDQALSWPQSSSARPKVGFDNGGKQLGSHKFFQSAPKN